MARPTFTIDPVRIKGLREEAGKTQLQIAKELHKKLKPTAPEGPDAALISTYQRIERTGRTSRKKAEALAEIFSVSVELLQGLERPEPFDYIKELATLLEAQLEIGKTDLLLRAFEEVKKRDTPCTNQEAFEILAEDIGQRIEAVQLGRNPSEIAELVKLTGLPEAELMKPSNVRGGHWLVIVTGSLVCHRTDIQLGTTWLCHHIQDVINEELKYFIEDASIHMWIDGPWFRIEVRRPRLHDVMRIDFVRCQPDQGRGMRWADATWREKFSIGGDPRPDSPEPLAAWAFNVVNFVTDFKGRTVPRNLRKLCFVITEHEGYVRSTGKMVVRSNHDEISNQRLCALQRRCESHAVFTRSLLRDLRQSLQLYLSEYPLECWEIEANACIDIRLKRQKDTERPTRSSGLFELRFRIALKEETGDNEFVVAPWRQADKQEICDQIKNWLGQAVDLGDSFEQRKFFEPVNAVEE